MDAATACVKNEDFLRYLDRYKAASNIGSALKEQLGLAYRLTTGGTLVCAACALALAFVKAYYVCLVLDEMSLHDCSDMHHPFSLSSCS